MTLIGRVQAPFLGGGLQPQLNIMSRDGANNQTGIYMEGPMCCIGSCCDSTFNVKSAQGDIGMIRKEGPEGLADMAAELLTDADNFTMSWNQNIDMPTKVSLLGAMFLLDFMFFEDDGNFKCNPCTKECSIKLCDFFCCGMLVPCKIKCDCSDDKDKNGDGGGGGGSDCLWNCICGV